ncbi:glycoside hydrolase family 3 [Ophiostoma piceae UAMH 11346]|uniref:beta-glucosidase n=1 Tax=Ophiostoma piceae (strain UAMH 11346) TaxID=1262450 RepID=S3BVJ8_OPHP1|nr:glycoside hydrolase family 3 [Ophiostoma piceae UAMH 11346]
MTANIDIDAVLQSLTLEEKITLLAGKSFWDTAAIPSKGVPSVIFTDGPNGTRGVRIDGSTKAACFPAAVGLASTFDGDIAHNIGVALAEEAGTKGARCLLAPTVCIQRHPLGGRNFETYSEDPFLSGSMAHRMISGIQASGNVVATIKHFVANEQESCRTTSDSRMSERTLREIYLRPFEIAIKSENPPYAVMTSYNRVNGTHADGKKRLIEEILRGEWGWRGLVMSDWGGTNSVGQALEAGLDLEMPGPPRKRTIPAVLDAIKAGTVSVDTIDTRARAILEFIERVGGWDNTEPSSSEGALDRPEHRRLIRDAGSRGIVMLKNANKILPLSTAGAPKTIALIGLAKDALAHGGGSASVNPHYKISPWEGLREALGDKCRFIYAKGTRRLRLLPPLRVLAEKGGVPDTSDDPNPDTKPGGTVHGLDGKPGFTIIFHDADADGQLVKGAKPKVIHGHPMSAFSPLGNLGSENKVVEIVGDFVPKESGSHCLSCSGIGPAQMFINDNLVLDQTTNSPDPMGALFSANTEPEICHAFEAGETYRLRICTRPPTNMAASGLSFLEGRSGVRLGFVLASDRDNQSALLTEAADAAAAADVSIVFTGHDPQWETEGRDQDSFNLPLAQNELVATVAKAAPAGKTVVVNCTGTPVAMPWLSDVGAVLQAWFLGQECGRAIADVITGAMNPEGHLPVSFPRRLEDAPAYGNFGAELTDPEPVVDYAEGVFVGYRFYDQKPASALNFPFGHGLSYTTFSVGSIDVAFNDTEATVSVRASITNTGSVFGGVALQLYAGRSDAVPAPSAPDLPVKALVAFKKVRLSPGASQEVVLEVPLRNLAYFDDVKSQQWLVDPGNYKLSFGFSATDIRQSSNLCLDRLFSFGK